MSINIQYTPGVALLLVALVTGGGCRPGGTGEDSTQTTETQLTFNRHIAPIVFAHCAPCHRPGEAGPFSLLTYRDVASRGQQIVEVTSSRYMPPWLPEPGHLSFQGDRRLSSEELESVAAWVEDGAIEGDPADLPPQPESTDGWLLGTPDRVFEMQSVYHVDAEGTDIFRNFVVPVEISEDRYVAAFEFRPGSPPLVHHADIRIDTTGGSRELDALDVEPGFDGIFGGNALAPGGVFLGWTPGRVPTPPDRTVAWPLRKDTDIIFQLHLQPTGKPESIQSSIGVYFADQTPSHFPFAISIGCRFFDIPPGAKSYQVQRSYTLPVDAHLASVYPHAHFLGKHIRGWATFSDGRELTLIEIKDWDFNWQDQYTYEEPILLPRGTTVTMRYVYDNSAENIRNPNHPPRRVVYGPNSSDEMGELMLQLVIHRAEDFEKLAVDYGEVQIREMIVDLKRTLEVDPENVNAIHELGAWYSLQEDFEKAGDYFSREVELRQDDARKAKALLYLALSYHKRGLAGAAEQTLRQAIQFEPALARCWFALGDLLAGQGRLDDAVTQFERGLERDPERVDILSKVAILSVRLQDLLRGEAVYQRILEIEPDNVNAHFNLGNVLVMQKKIDPAAEHYEVVIGLRPEFAQAHKQLGVIYAMRQEYAKAAESFERALAMDDNLADAHYNLGMVREQQGRDAEAVRHFRRRMSAAGPSVQAALRLAWILATSPDDGVRRPDEAVALAKVCVKATGREDPVALDCLAAAYAAIGDYEQAAALSELAHSLAISHEHQELAIQIEARRQLYRQGQPYRREHNNSK